MKKIKIDSKQILALAATFYQAYMSFYRFPGDSRGEFITYFKEREDEMNCLQTFIERCQQEKVPIRFEKYPPLRWEQRLQYRLFQKRSLTERELGTAAFFCRELLQVIADPSAEAIKKTKFFHNCSPFCRCVLFPHLTLRQIHNAHRIDFYYHTFFWTSFSLKEILSAKQKLVSIYIKNPNKQHQY
ncbi:hypothetical protein [[Flexibacter] sp. ATCC 35208]|uniref:hypothetical protein n=1 Tax=[Flexibacter] sp. ATCC 35208 TaxID=1936242 RepID=UPI0009D20BDE|nr:hypothetical protein [[Flexibacter] sp. ATCC 35208]OMP75333.1 hypothetical protein BW716_30640 [[Flexibacter] sp. ATCC 35208]